MSSKRPDRSSRFDQNNNRD